MPTRDHPAPGSREQAPAAAENPLLALRGIRKTFPGIVANDGVDLDLYAGEIHALLGENGAGKTTLMNILAGLYQPDEGAILMEGRPIEVRSPRDAYRHGIGMVHQHFRLVPSLTVAENILLGLDRAPSPSPSGRERESSLTPSPRARERVSILTPSPPEGERVRVRGRFGLRLQDHLPRIEALARRFNLLVDPRARVWQLSVGEQQRVEIVKMLYRGVRILILDEPTSALTPQETEGLLATLRGMAAQGRAIFFISHKLAEVLAIADRISILRRGRRVATLRPGETEVRGLASLMVGEALSEAQPERGHPGETVLDVRNLRVRNDRGMVAVRGVSLAVRAGEVLGIAGVAGNGQQELAEALAGLRPVEGGTVLLAGAEITHLSPRARIVRGLRYLPADRRHVAVAPNLSIAENLILKSFRDPAFGPAWWQDRDAVAASARQQMAAFNVVGGTPDTPVRLLSGGNLQKVLLARELAVGETFLLAQSPTRGLDVRSTLFVQDALRAQARGGQAVLLISEDLDEIFLLADRIAVMFAGEITGVLPAAQATREAVGLLMAGTRTS